MPRKVPKRKPNPPESATDALIRRLWRLRNHLILTQEELGRVMGIPQQTMSNWCRGYKYPRPSGLRKIEHFERLHGLPFELPFPQYEARRKTKLGKPKRKTITLRNGKGWGKIDLRVRELTMGAELTRMNEHLVEGV